MKKFLSYLMLMALFVSAFSLTSCQEEYESIDNGQGEAETLLASSSTAQLIQNTSSHDGSYDNIVDEANCFALQFPYTVNVNGIEITIDSKEDLQTIEDIFDEFDTDDDFLEIIFPITITMADFSEITINNKEELRAMAAECRQDDDDIECIDFVYPIKLYTFDAQLEQTGSVTVESDMQLRRFFKELDDNDIVSIDFPVTLKLYDGTEVVVDSNAELARAIEAAKDACDEDDDNDYNDDDFDLPRLNEYLQACPWLIHEVKRDGVLQTEQYVDYVMSFREDNTVLVKNSAGASMEGTWATSLGANGVQLNLEFDTLVDFNLTWTVYELEAGKIKLYSDDNNKIIMHKACQLGDAYKEQLRNILAECGWVIKKVVNQGQEVERLLGYEFSFMADGSVTLSDGTTTGQGTWEITTSANGMIVMAITMGDEPGVSFEWPLRELLDTYLKFEVGDYELILYRNCESDQANGDLMEIRNIMMGGEWSVAAYTEGDFVMTDFFDGYGFDFAAQHQVNVTHANSTETIPFGRWMLIRDGDGHIRFFLNFGTELEPLKELTDAWKLVSVTANRLELMSISGDGTVETLVFEK